MNFPRTTGFDPTDEIPRSALFGDVPRRARRARNWFWIIVGWPALLAVVAVMILRWQEPERTLVIALVGLTPLFVAPLVVGLIGAWWGRSPTLRVFGAAVTAAFLFTVSPVNAVVGCGATEAADGITVYTANVLAGQGRHADVADAVAAEDPDIVVMQEVEWPFLREFQNDPRMDRYPYRTQDVVGEAFGRPLFSRWPIVDYELERFANTTFVHVRIAGPTGDFIITNVHTSAPAVADNVPPWHDQFDQLLRLDRTTPRILAGDFNATRDHQPLRELMDAGWTDVHEEKGCGFNATWPVDSGLPFAVYRLDHVLVTEHFEVLDVRFGPSGGSDHKPVIASVRLR